jgi:hypothetical protein
MVDSLSITVRATAAPATAPPRGMHTFIAPITSRAIITDHNLAIITGRNRATTGLAGADTEVGKSSWFFGFMLSGVVFSAAKEFAPTGHLPGRLNGEFHVIFALTAILAAIIRRQWFHEVLAPVFAALFLLYITLLFGRL